MLNIKFFRIEIICLLCGGSIFFHSGVAEAKTKYVYDELGRLIESSDDNSKEVYEYDANGNITATTFHDNSHSDSPDRGSTAPSDQGEAESETGSLNTDEQNQNEDNRVVNNANVTNTDTKNADNDTGKDLENQSIKESKTISVGNLVYQVIHSKKKTVKVVGTKNKNKKKYSVPDKIKIAKITYKVVEIAPNAFKNYKKATSISIGKNVEKIGKNTFYGCKKLKMLNISSTRIKNVGKNALKGIYKKAKIKVPKKKLEKYKKIFKNKGQKKSVKIIGK